MSKTCGDEKRGRYGATQQYCVPGALSSMLPLETPPSAPQDPALAT
jgi:hypothetical protein